METWRLQLEKRPLGQELGRSEGCRVQSGRQGDCPAPTVADVPTLSPSVPWRATATQLDFLLCVVLRVPGKTVVRLPRGKQEVGKEPMDLGAAASHYAASAPNPSDTGVSPHPAASPSGWGQEAAS